MHAHEQLLNTLFQCLNSHNHDGMAACYHEDARFEDIAFTLSGRQKIRAMWEMICSKNDLGPSDIKAAVQELVADELAGRAVVIDDYTFRDTGRHVHNKIESKFTFKEGLIISQIDTCDAASWGRQALGGAKGFVSGHIGFIRRRAAMRKLDDFIEWRDRHQSRAS